MVLLLSLKACLMKTFVMQPFTRLHYGPLAFTKVEICRSRLGAYGPLYDSRVGPAGSRKKTRNSVSATSRTMMTESVMCPLTHRRTSTYVFFRVG